MATSRFWNFGYASNSDDHWTFMPELVFNEFDPSLAVALLPIDANRDGWMDLYATFFTIDGSEQAARLLINDKDGTFSLGSSSLISGGAPGNVGGREVITGDFNGDGVDDIFVAEFGYDGYPFPGHQDQLLLSRPGGGFVNATANLPQLSDTTHSADAADIDGDGDLDIYVGNLGFFAPWPEQHDIPALFLINDGTGHFTEDRTGIPQSIIYWDGGPENSYWAGGLPYPPSFTTEVFLDADNDGDQDLFLGGDSQPHALLLNDGTGHFTKSTRPMADGIFGALNTVTNDAVTMDFDGDGFLDVLVHSCATDFTGQRIQALRSDGQGGFTDVTSKYFDRQLPVGNGIQWFHRVDLNGDGAIDIVVDTHSGQLPYVNDGTGHFILAPKVSHASGTAWFDINKDGRTDVAQIGMGGDTFGWMHRLFQKDASIKTIKGTKDDDTILGGNTKQTISGEKGRDFLFGSGGNDTLKGGAATDTLIGGLGSDTADFSDKSKAVVVTLKAGANVTAKIGGASEDKLTSIENLWGGSKADRLTGDTGKNILKGNAGSDKLNGGLGKDTLTGGDGKDKFVFNTKLSASNVDTIKDLRHDTDLIQLDDSIFKRIGSRLDSSEFYAAKGAVKAHDKSDRIVYDTKTGKLYFDADGNKKGGVDAIHFATLTRHPSLDHGDFDIV